VNPIGPLKGLEAQRLLEGHLGARSENFNFALHPGDDCSRCEYLTAVILYMNEFEWDRNAIARNYSRICSIKPRRFKEPQVKTYEPKNAG